MFKESFKYYKSRISPPILKDVIDFNSLSSNASKVRELEINISHEFDCFDLIPLKKWNIFELTEKPGLIFIRNPFTCLGQRYWTVRCLEDYSKKPNKLNLDPFSDIPSHEDWWQLCQRLKNDKLLQKLRWATLGYHHNWDTKVYSENSRGDFPADLALLSQRIARALGYNNFKAQAAIVNYYHMDSTLSGHTDHSEVNLDAPLLSFSFGQSAIFLLGGKTLEENPTALFLHSGDVVIMSKEARLCYHGVPKIQRNENSPWKENNFSDITLRIPEDYCNESIVKCQDEVYWESFDNYLNSSRININVRQVLQQGQDCL